MDGWELNDPPTSGTETETGTETDCGLAGCTRK